MLLTYALLLVACLLTVTGEVLLKLGMNALGGFTISPAGLWRTFTDWRVFFGFVLVFGGALFWLAVISRVDLSFAYPLLALNYLLIMLPSYYILGEAITPQKIVGALIIIAGMIVLTWNSASSA